MFCMWGFITSTLPCSSITVTAIWRMKYSSLKNRKSYKNTEDLLFTFAEKLLPQKLKMIQEYMEGGQRALLIHCMVSQHCWIIHKYAAVLIRPWHVPYLLLCSFGQFTKQLKSFYVFQFLSAKLICCIRRTTTAMWKLLKWWAGVWIIGDAWSTRSGPIQFLLPVAGFCTKMFFFTAQFYLKYQMEMVGIGHNLYMFYV